MEDLKKYTVLIVDDDQVVQTPTVFDFKRRGFNVLSAENGMEAIELVKANKVDLVLSDIRMPGGDGVEFLERAKAYNPQTPIVIMMTGYSDFSEGEVLSKGANKVFFKPFDRKKLMEYVFQVLGIPIEAKASPRI